VNRSAEGSSSPGRATGRKLDAALFAASFACIVVNLPTLFTGFIQDDHTIIERNELVRDLSRLPEIFSNNYWMSEHPAARSLYRPVTILSYALNGAVGGVRPFGFRLVNLALHLLVTLLVLFLGRLVLAEGKRRVASVREALLAPASVAAILFAIHPVHTEVLGAVVGRAELLAAAGTLGCVLAFLAARQRQGSRRRGSAALFDSVSIACFIAAFLAKENALAAPLLVLLADRLLVGGRASIRYHVAAGVALGFLLVARFAVLGGSGVVASPGFGENPLVGAPFAEGRLTALGVIARYALLLVAPIRMSVDYSYNAIPIARGLSDPMPLLGGAIVLAWAAAVWSTRKRSPGIAFSLAWIGVTLLPTANLLFLIGTIMGERLLYLPSVGFCLVTAGAISGLRARLVARAPTPARVAAARFIVPAVLLALGVRTEVRLRDWRDDYTIFKSALAVVPDSYSVEFSYGVEAAERGDLEAARRAHQRSIEIWPDFGEAHWNLGYVLLRLGRDEEARQALRRAIRLVPSSYEAHTNLGAAELRLDDPRAAARSFRMALHLRPGEPRCYIGLGLAQEAVGEAAGAVVTYRRGLRVAPGDPGILVRLGRALLMTGDRQGARQALEQIARLDPDGDSMDAEARELLRRLHEENPP
jgi:Flp pilus assembly protein TadD